MPTPDSPHMANLFLLLAGGLMGWLFFVGLARWPAANRSTTRGHLRLLLGWGYFWVLVLLVNAAVVASDRTRWTAIAGHPPLGSLAAVAAAANGTQVLLVGRAASKQAPGVDPGMAYVVEFDADGQRWAGDGDLAVSVADSVQHVSGVDRASSWNWRYQRSIPAQHFLAAGDPVVVLGTVRHGTSLAQADRGARVVWLEAVIVRRGSHSDFVGAAEAQSRRLWPRILAWASLCAAIVVGLVPLLCRARRASAAG